MKTIYLLLIVMVMLFTIIPTQFVTASLEVGFDNPDSPRISISIPSTDTSNYTLVDTNSSEFWDALDTPADINAGDITDDNTYVSTSGDIITGDINISGNLNVSGDTYLGGDLMPTESLTHSIGSGVLRWLKLFVATISADFLDATSVNATEICIGDTCVSDWADISGTGIWTNESGTATYPSNVSIDGNLTVKGGAIFKGATLGDMTLFTHNIRFGVFAHTPRIIFDNGSVISQMDYVGDTMRFIFNTSVGNRVTMRLNSTDARLGATGYRRNLIVWGDIITKNPAGGGGNVKIDGSLTQIKGNATINTYYGEVWFHNDTGVSVGTLNTTYQTMNIFESDESGSILNGFSSSANGLTLNVDGGVYRSKWEATGSGVNNHYYHGCLFINEECQYNTNQHVIADANNQVRMAKAGLVEINAGDNVSLRVKDTDSTSAGTIYIADITLERIAN